ncbi:hypothetical protein K502DRAFT_348341 [Neoconidiobolus thromboides FSU 785]|nr:hypothetical protein K502DRAFT_348341 [Neoconidiobolus thromboides FSU 785]
MFSLFITLDTVDHMVIEKDCMQAKIFNSNTYIAINIRKNRSSISPDSDPESKSNYQQIGGRRKAVLNQENENAINSAEISNSTDPTKKVALVGLDRNAINNYIQNNKIGNSEKSNLNEIENSINLLNKNDGDIVLDTDTTVCSEKDVLSEVNSMNLSFIQLMDPIGSKKDKSPN